jgi:hypothetical protein
MKLVIREVVQQAIRLPIPACGTVAKGVKENGGNQTVQEALLTHLAVIPFRGCAPCQNSSIRRLPRK